MRKTSQSEIRNIQKSKGSYYVTLPMATVKKLGLKERQKVTVRPKPGRRIEIKDWKK